MYTLREHINRKIGDAVARKRMHPKAGKNCNAKQRRSEAKNGKNLDVKKGSPRHGTGVKTKASILCD